MSDSDKPIEPLKPENAPIQIDEQSEAAIVANIEKVFSNHDPRTSIVKSMVDFKAIMVEKGMTPEFVNSFIGKMRFDVDPELYGTGIYLKMMELCADNAFKLYEIFLQDFDANTFADMAKNLSVRVKLPRIQLPPPPEDVE